MSTNIKGENLNTFQYMKQIVEDELDEFNHFVAWTEQDKKEFRYLLDSLKNTSNTNGIIAKDKGDCLENLVEFIIRKTYFFEIYKNVHTETNEIDEIIVLSDRGKVALHKLDLPRDLIPIEQDLVIGECKNYRTNLNVTYVGKFYSLLTVTGVKFGLIFTQKGLTGTSEGYKDAYGLTKILRIVELAKNRDFYILTFTLDDYEKLLMGKTFFELITAKKLEMKLASNYENFLKDNKHEAEEEIKDILSERA